jgi:hypothetical protein
MQRLKHGVHGVEQQPPRWRRFCEDTMAERRLTRTAALATPNIDQSQRIATESQHLIYKSGRSCCSRVGSSRVRRACACSATSAWPALPQMMGKAVR